jgi:hypothetical protein
MSGVIEWNDASNAPPIMPASHDSTHQGLPGQHNSYMTPLRAYNLTCTIICHLRSPKHKCNKAGGYYRKTEPTAHKAKIHTAF